MATGTGAAPYDAVIVGAGAAGAVLAARLAEYGARVLVIEAGGDPLAAESQPSGGRDLRADYRVPGFNAFASENPGIRADLFVRHYGDRARQERDWKFTASEDGVLYPRAKGLGGCSAHHAMITVKPNDCDWNHIVHVTGDRSWRASNMQRYWERIERCRYRAPFWRWLARWTGWNPLGHGWTGWLQTEYAMPLGVLADRPLRNDIIRSLGAAASAFPGAAADFELARFDPNDRDLWNPHASGVRVPPLSTRRHARTGARERLLAAMNKPANRIDLVMHAEVERVELQGGRARAVHYRKDGVLHRAEGRQIVLAGGAFRTPQLMMLSGLGPADHLREMGIDPVADLPGVGANLQDRYEIGVANEMARPWSALKGVRYSVTDRPYRWWKWLRMGPYKSNGTVFSVELKSRPDLTAPDLFCFSVLVNFQGYYPGYSEDTKPPNFLTWAILKAYTRNNAGTVRLRSRDAAVPPEVNFRYFDEGNGDWQDDLDAVVLGVKFARKISESMGDQIKREHSPGRAVQSDEDLRQYVKDHAWGHHACGTCAMKPMADGGVVDSRFQVHGIKGLRIVDASVFPRIPGYFLISSVYMIAEKAADTLAQDLRTSRRPG